MRLYSYATKVVSIAASNYYLKRRLLSWRMPKGWWRRPSSCGHRDIWNRQPLSYTVARAYWEREHFSFAHSPKPAGGGG